VFGIDSKDSLRQAMINVNMLPAGYGQFQTDWLDRLLEKIQNKMNEEVAEANLDVEKWLKEVDSKISGQITQRANSATVTLTLARPDSPPRVIVKKDVEEMEDFRMSSWLNTFPVIPSRFRKTNRTISLSSIQENYMTHNFSSIYMGKSITAAGIDNASDDVSLSLRFPYISKNLSHQRRTANHTSGLPLSAKDHTARARTAALMKKTDMLRPPSNPSPALEKANENSMVKVRHGSKGLPTVITLRSSALKLSENMIEGVLGLVDKRKVVVPGVNVIHGGESGVMGSKFATRGRMNPTAWSVASVASS
jgi:hypothetical protein